jgi:hypothetical protein
MDRLPVDSSNVASVGYDEEATILEIEFLSGRYLSTKMRHLSFEFSEQPPLTRAC